MTRETYLSVQALRALAILSVLVFHSGLLMPGQLFEVPVLTHFGWVGVRLFFVISGFVIAATILRYQSGLLFVLRRYLRVLPLYAICTVVALLLHRAAPDMDFHLSYTDSGAAFEPGRWYYLKSLFILPQDPWPYLGVGWSLEFELVFYSAFGLAALIVSPFAGRALLAAAGLAGAFISGSPNHLVHVYMLYFLAGVLCHDLLVRDRSPSVPVLAGAVAVSVPIWIALLYAGRNETQPAFVFSSTVSFAGLLLLAVRLEASGRLFRRTSLLTRIGDSSYALYLVHWISLNVVIFLISDVTLSPLAAESVRWGWIAATIALAYGVFLWIERPIDRRLKQAVRRSRQEFAAEKPSS